MTTQTREEFLALLDDVKAKSVEINAELEKVDEGVALDAIVPVLDD
jgi:hypothetical protein